MTNDLSGRIAHEMEGAGTGFRGIKSDDNIYMAMVDSAFDAIITASLDGIIHTWNPACERLFGYTSREAIGRSVEMLALPGHTTDQDRIFAQMAAGTTITLETQRLRKDGSLFDVLFSAAPIKDDQGGIFSFVATLHDLTEHNREKRRAAEDEKALRESEARSRQQLVELERIYDAAPIGLAVLSEDLRYSRVNLYLAEMSGLGVEDYIGKTIHEIFPGRAEGLAERARHLFERGQIMVFDVEGVALNGSGAMRSWGVTWLPLKREDGEVIGINMVVEDITRRKSDADEACRVAELLEQRVIERTADLEREMTERHRAQAILHQMQKIETTGHLTGGIAHDFNNMLGVISGNISRVNHRLKPGDSDLRRFTENAMKGVERAAALTRQLLAFARRQPLQATSVDVNELVRNIKELLGRTLGEKVAIDVALPDELWAALADTNQLENALLNLAVNARDAMPGGGRLTMKTANTVLDEEYAACNVEVAAGEYVMIAVTDTGVGMTPETVAMAFEPFFTTKEDGHGSGLGLSQVYGFIKQSGGHVTILSKPGGGTTVTLYLPRLATLAVPSPAPSAEVAEGVPAATARETILVVEDDDGVRASTVGILRDLGYRVFAEADGHAALRTLDRTASIDLLLTDVGLPDGLPGTLLAEKARLKKPRLKILLTSGYALDAVSIPRVPGPGEPVLAKPFSYAVLARKVRHVLDRVSASGTLLSDRTLSLAERSGDPFAIAVERELGFSGESRCPSPH